eukprot:scaffold19346_cov24-Tisochrysis_lutea.AAC.1
MRRRSVRLAPKAVRRPHSQRRSSQSDKCASTAVCGAHEARRGPARRAVQHPSRRSRCHPRLRGVPARRVDRRKLASCAHKQQPPPAAMQRHQAFGPRRPRPIVEFE